MQFKIHGGTRLIALIQYFQICTFKSMVQHTPFLSSKSFLYHFSTFPFVQMYFIFLWRWTIRVTKRINQSPVSMIWKFQTKIQLRIPRIFIFPKKNSSKINKKEAKKNCSQGKFEKNQQRRGKKNVFGLILRNFFHFCSSREQNEKMFYKKKCSLLQKTKMFYKMFYKMYYKKQKCSTKCRTKCRTKTKIVILPCLIDIV